MATIDLDAAAAARAEARKEPNNFIFRGQTFDLPDELSIEALAAQLRGDFIVGMRLMLDPPCEHDDVHENATCPAGTHTEEADLPCACPPAECAHSQMQRFMALHPSVEDVKTLGTGMAPLYGFGDPGEASASSGSSKSNGSRSRPTSPASTASTSRKRSGRTTPAKGSRSAG